jgi:hypothetical protein
MKKITLFVAAVAVLASCNREDALTTQSGGIAGNLNVRNFEKSELQDMITPMSQSFGFNGKAAATQANYTYRSWAEPVQLDLTLSGIPGTEAGVLIKTTGGSNPIDAFVNLSASAAWSVNDMVFVVWHAADPGTGLNSTAHNVNGAGNNLVGGAITAYKQVGIGQYEFMDRVDFYDADYHELYGDVNASSQNYEIMMAGQRAQTTSGYVLAGHAGAVITRIDYDYVNDEFWEDSFRELPLPGTSANDVVGAARRFYVTTGGSGVYQRGAVYEFDRNMQNINKGAQLEIPYSGRAIAIDKQMKGTNPLVPSVSELNTDELFVLGTNASDVVLYQETIEFDDILNPLATNWDQSFSTNNVLNSATSQLPHNLLERADITIASSDDNPFTTGVDPINRSLDRIFLTLPYANGGSGVSSVYNLEDIGGGLIKLNSIDNIGNAISTEYDAGLDVLYVAMAGNGGPGGMAIKVIALDNFAGQSAVVNLHDLVGEFADPNLPNLPVTYYTGNMPAQFKPTIQDVKEITVFGSRNIALAAGSQGVFFIQRDKY